MRWNAWRRPCRYCGRWIRLAPGTLRHGWFSQQQASPRSNLSLMVTTDCNELEDEVCLSPSELLMLNDKDGVLRGASGLAAAEDWQVTDFVAAGFAAQGQLSSRAEQQFQKPWPWSAHSRRATKGRLLA